MEARGGKEGMTDYCNEGNANATGIIRSSEGHVSLSILGLLGVRGISLDLRLRIICRISPWSYSPYKPSLDTIRNGLIGRGGLKSKVLVLISLQL